MEHVVEQPGEPVVVHKQSAMRRWPAEHICCCTDMSGGVWVGDFKITACMIYCMGICGWMVIIPIGIFMVIISNFPDEYSAKFYSPGIILLVIGVLLGLFSCLCCGISHKGNAYERRTEVKKQQKQQYEPYTDTENSEQEQPDVGQPVVSTGSPVDVPMQSDMLPPTPYPHQSTGVSDVHQPSQSGIDTVPGESPYPGPPYSAPEYDQQPAYAPQKIPHKY